MSADGNRIVVGSPQNTQSNGANQGFISIYDYNRTSWNLVASFTGEANFDYFGYSVAISDDGSTVVAEGLNNTSSAGYAEVFRLNAST